MAKQTWASCLETDKTEHTWQATRRILSLLAHSEIVPSSNAHRVFPNLAVERVEDLE